MTARPAPPIERLEVLLDAEVQTVLEPGCETYVIGRGRQCQLRIGGAGPSADRNISRTVASVRWRRGAWTVQNDSRNCPLDVLVDSAVVPLRPLLDGTEPATFVLGPRGATLRVSGLGQRIDIELRPTGAGPDSVQIPAPDPRDPSTLQLRRPTPHDAQLLAAKFLSRRRSGYAIGNEQAADRVNTVRDNVGTRVTARAVENSVARWREQLQLIGVAGIEGRENINQLGIELLKHGVLSESDRLVLPIVDAFDDHG